MSTGKYEKPSTTRSLWFPVVAAVTFIVFLLIFALRGCEDVPRPNQGNLTATVEKNPDSIAIPGYEMLELKAGRKEQTICLANPPQNDCYFKISLYLEDGTLLWQSELIEPGKTSKAMVLTTALKKGTYPNAVLLYSCYRMDESLSPLNGAQMKVTLWVK